MQGQDRHAPASSARSAGNGSNAKRDGRRMCLTPSLPTSECPARTGYQFEPGAAATGASVRRQSTRCNSTVRRPPKSLITGR